MLSLGALGMGPGWPGKILPSPPSPPSPTLALTELALTELALIELALIELALTELLVFKKCCFFAQQMNQELIKVPCFQKNVVCLSKNESGVD